MNKLLLVSLTLCSLPVASQTIECQILKEQILGEIRQQQVQQNPTIQSDTEYALKNFRGMNSAEIGAAQAYAGGAAIGRGMLQGAGQPSTLQDRINLYKQKCE